MKPCSVTTFSLVNPLFRSQANFQILVVGIGWGGKVVSIKIHTWRLIKYLFILMNRNSQWNIWSVLWIDSNAPIGSLAAQCRAMFWSSKETTHGNGKGSNSPQRKCVKIKTTSLNIYKLWGLMHPTFRSWEVTGRTSGA